MFYKYFPCHDFSILKHLRHRGRIGLSRNRKHSLNRPGNGPVFVWDILLIFYDRHFLLKVNCITAIGSSAFKRRMF